MPSGLIRMAMRRSLAKDLQRLEAAASG